MASENHFEKPAQRKSVLVRNSSYRDNCSAGFTSGDWQAHHIACHHSVNTREIEDEYLEYVENCLWITEWDLNASENLIGLPVNKQYRSSNGMSPTNYCSHQVDHNTKAGYTAECTQWLQLNLWNTLKAKDEKHEVTARQVRDQLQSCTSTFKAKLEQRGQRMGGTAHCWKNRFSDRPQYVAKWYAPFSMGKHPSKRHPGVDTDKWDKMLKIFKLIF